MADNNLEELILCRHCNATLRIPKTSQRLKITCPRCHSVFSYNVPIISERGRFKLILGCVIIAVVVALSWLNLRNQSNTTPSNWITISYGGLVDSTILTHSGETVGEVITRLPRFTDDAKGLVQPYLEPFSVLCHDVLLSINGPDTLPLVNILDHYPIGSEQPAWVSLFREGHYQIYYNHRTIRVFIKGLTVYNSFDKHRSVIRHAINDVSNSKNTSIERVDVYVFTNDYATTKIRLNTVPVTYSVEGFRYKTRPGSIDLGSIDEFLKEGIILEAVEVDDNNDLYFYGKESSKQTLAGYPVSLADIAVIYRSVFHYGDNSPYISLDKHEDNRFAKVNFGGHLENTHAGHVVLEADKLFKTLSTGLDPNTHRIIKKQISQNVPNFLTQLERTLMENNGSRRTQIRYWFYPDSIGTVTDGSIGAVLTNQFLADVERMDMPISAGKAVRNTIEHLNSNFGQYERAFTTFRELSTVGRIMSLINWLKGMEMDSRIELDDLLSVKIPAFTTRTKTKKMLAITAIAYPEHFRIKTGYVRKYSKEFYISNLLNEYDPNTPDSIFLQAASDYFDALDENELTSPQEQDLQAQIEDYKQNVDSLQQKIESLEEQIKRSKRTLNSKSSDAINNHNKLVDKFNSLLKTQEVFINKYKVLIDKYKSMNIMFNHIFWVSGGIDLQPKQFKRIQLSNNAPQIRKISSLKSTIRSVGKISKSGNWIRNTVGKRGARVNTLPVNRWELSKSSNGSIKYDYTAGKNDRLTVKVSPDGGGWFSKVSVNGNSDVVKYSEGTRSLEVNHAQIGVIGSGVRNIKGTAVVFGK